MLHIDSTQNARLKYLIRLKEKRSRHKEKRYVIEGMRECRRAIQGWAKVERLYSCPEYLSAEEHREVLVWCDEGQLEHASLSPRAADKLSYRQQGAGVVAEALIVPREFSSVRLSSRPLLLLLDGLEKPGNIGALLRSADAVGVDAVLVSGLGADIYNPNVIRASMGSLFNRPVVVASEQELRAWLEHKGVRIIAATADEEQSYWDVDFRRASCVVLGTEDQGLSSFWLDAAEECAHIPMSREGLADSLNVASSGALLLYEALRQRR